MPARKDPRIAEVVALLPADGSGMTHRNWRAAIVASGKSGNLKFMRAAQQSGDAVFEILDPEAPADSLTVKRAPTAPTA